MRCNRWNFATKELESNRKRKNKRIASRWLRCGSLLLDNSPKAGTKQSKACARDESSSVPHITNGFISLIVLLQSSSSSSSSSMRTIVIVSKFKVQIAKQIQQSVQTQRIYFFKENSFDQQTILFEVLEIVQVLESEGIANVLSSLFKQKKERTVKCYLPRVRPRLYLDFLPLNIWN